MPVDLRLRRVVVLLAKFRDDLPQCPPVTVDVLQVEEGNQAVLLDQCRHHLTHRAMYCRARISTPGDRRAAENARLRVFSALAMVEILRRSRLIGQLCLDLRPETAHVDGQGGNSGDLRSPARRLEDLDIGFDGRLDRRAVTQPLECCRVPGLAAGLATCRVGYNVVG